MVRWARSQISVYHATRRRCTLAKEAPIPLLIKLIWILFLTFAALPASAQTSSERVSEQEGECSIELPQWASAPERFAWKQICLGRNASMPSSTGFMDGTNFNPISAKEPWPKSRELSAKFIELIVTQEPYVSASPRSSINIFGAVIVGEIDLSETRVVGSVYLIRSMIHGGMNLRNSVIRGDVHLTGSDFAQSDLNAAGINVTGDLKLNYVSAKNIDFYGAKVGRDFGASFANVEKRFSVESMKIGGRMFMVNSTLGDVVLRNTKVGADFSASETKFLKSFAADDLTTGGDVFLRRIVVAQDMGLRGMVVAGDFDLDGAQISGNLQADGSSIHGNLFLRGNAKVGTIELRDARIAKTLDARTAVISGWLRASRLEVNEIFLDSAHVHSGVELVNAKIQGDLSAVGVTISGPFAADSITVGSDVYLRENGSFTSINLSLAKIAGTVQLQTSHITGKVWLSGATIGELILWQGTDDVAWGENAQFFLRNLTVNALQARMPQSWQTPDGKRIPVDLGGFSYTRLGGAQDGTENDLSRIDAAAMIDWIEGPLPSGLNHNDGYAPQPYRELETTLLSMGAEEQANYVAFQRNLHQTRSRSSDASGWMYWMGDQVLRWTVGYGIYPFRALWWFLGLVLLGVFVTMRSGVLTGQGAIVAFWYSVANATPVIGISHDHGAGGRGNIWVQSFFHFQKIAGFVLATILVGALTLLSG